MVASLNQPMDPGPAQPKTWIIGLLSSGPSPRKSCGVLFFFCGGGDRTPAVDGCGVKERRHLD